MALPTDVPPGLVDRILSKHQHEESALIAILQDIQEEVNWLPRPLLREVASRLSIPLSRVYAIASFYKAFSLKPRGRYLVQCCTGTACHVRGGTKIRESIQNFLGVREGETTRNGKFTLEMVRCLGCCSLAPVVQVGGDFYGQLEGAKILKTLKEYE